MQDFRGKTAFITGGANGIGRAIAERLAKEGVAVAIADINAEASATTCKAIEESGARAMAIVCDVTSEESMQQAARDVEETFGPVHLLINNAGAFSVTAFDDTTRHDWEWLMEINVMGVVNGLHAFLPGMRAHGEAAHIINTASVSGHIGTPMLSIYTASKFAVVGLSECLRHELAETPIRISVLCPGIVNTGLPESSRVNRPARHGGPLVEANLDFDAVTASGTDPAEIGDQVLAGLKAERFYILTHPAVRPAFAKRFERILTDYDGAN